MSQNQSTNHIIMIEPSGFLANPQTISTNKHQVVDEVPNQTIQENALKEHKTLVEMLQSKDIQIDLYKGKQETPDDLFCNNWVSFHEDKTYVLYPMHAMNRRLERRDDLCDIFKKDYDTCIDMSHYERDHLFLESTGSFVLDRVNKVAYAAISPRTDKTLFLEWCDKLGYEPVPFSWHYPDNQPVYHTNVIMYIGTQYAGVCVEGISLQDKDRVLTKLMQSHEIIELSFQQIHAFCGNAIELTAKDGKKYLAMSTQAYKALTQRQKEAIQKHVEIIHSDVSTIEKYGGGSVRCLILEQF